MKKAHATVALLTESVDWNHLLKFRCKCNHASLSSRRAWIEISVLQKISKCHPGRSPHGERGLKYICKAQVRRILTGRSPHGERGLKSLILHPLSINNNSRSPHGERGLKYFYRIYFCTCFDVALLTESVDWNLSRIVDKRKRSCVALLTESVDWNHLDKLAT